MSDDPNIRFHEVLKCTKERRENRGCSEHHHHVTGELNKGSKIQVSVQVYLCFVNETSFYLEGRKSI